MNNLIFPFADYWYVYAGFVAFIAAMLALDLGVFHRKVHAVSFKEAALWSAFWIGLALLINLGFFFFASHELAGQPQAAEIAKSLSLEFLTGFVIEKALAVDNIFLFVMIFSAFGIPAIYQHRVLFFGIIGAIFFRALFIAAGSTLMAYHWIVVFFGVFLALTGLKMLLLPAKAIDLKQSWLFRQLGRVIPMQSELAGESFFNRVGGTLYATPLFVALFFVEISDIIFAVDSVPAIFAITDEPLIVFVSNILAILGLRSLYFMLADIVHRFEYLKIGLALVLVFVGLKMAVLNELFGGKFPIVLSLGIISALILGSIILSVLLTGKKRTE